MRNTAFLLQPEIAEKVEKLKEELELDDYAEVISKAIELLDLSVGRKVVLKDMKKNRKYEIDELEDYNQTVTF